MAMPSAPRDAGRMGVLVDFRPMRGQASLPSRHPGQPGDPALVAAARAGQAWAREALFRRYGVMVNGMVQHLLPADSEHDDIVQDVFVACLDSLARLRSPEFFSSWLGGIVVRTVGRRLRRRKLLGRLGLRGCEPVALDGVLAPSAPPDVVLELRHMYSVMRGLPAEEHMALVLHRVDGLELGEIAGLMALSLSTVKRRIAAADQALERAREGRA